MNKYLWTWTLWIALAAAIITTLYLFTGLSVYNLSWMAFVSVPIYFGGGAKVEEFPHYFCSAAIGVVWGWLILKGAVILITAGLIVPIAMGIAVLIGAFLAVGIHMIPLGNTWFGKVPMVFGGSACAFATGGQHLIPVIITLAAGLVLGVLITLGGNFLQKHVFVDLES